MKKLLILAVFVMMTAFVSAVQAEVRCTVAQQEVRAGGLPGLILDNRITDCSCPPVCPPPIVEKKVPVPAPVVVPPPPPTPAPEPVPQPPPAPVPVKEKVSIILNVEFDTAKAIVKEKYYDDIKRVADFMKEYPDTTAVIEGHTDNVGNDAYNKALSEKRAQSVRQYIIDKFGIDGSRITAVGYGEEKPVAGNDTAQGRQKNRRVEAVLEATKTVYK